MDIDHEFTQKLFVCIMLYHVACARVNWRDVFSQHITADTKMLTVPSGTALSHRLVEVICRSFIVCGMWMIVVVAPLTQPILFACFLTGLTVSMTGYIANELITDKVATKLLLPVQKTALGCACMIIITMSCCIKTYMDMPDYCRHGLTDETCVETITHLAGYATGVSVAMLECMVILWGIMITQMMPFNRPEEVNAYTESNDQ